MDLQQRDVSLLDAIQRRAERIVNPDVRDTISRVARALGSTVVNSSDTFRDNLAPSPALNKRDYIVEDGYEGATYQLDIDRMRINDSVWGTCEIKDDPYDSLLLKLAETPLFRRLQAVEQLTFNGEFSTVPNTSRLSRWQHIWGSLVFVRKMTEGDARFTERERIVMQLRTLFSDVGQTSFSHLGDWVFQGLKGGEDLHDQDLRALLETSGIEELLGEYGLTLDETVFPEVEDWVECPSPALCVDRVDYGLREMLRWASPPLPLLFYNQQLENPKSLFEITDDGQLAIKDQKFARYFAAGFSLLPSDNWSHPTHRVMMELMQTAIREALLNKTSYTGSHPRDLMYGIDVDFDTYFLEWGGAGIGDIMKQIAFEQRRIFTVARKADLGWVFAGITQDDWQFPAFPDPLKTYSWKSEEFGKYPLPAQLSLKEESVDEQHMSATKKGLEIGLPRLKARRINPLVKTSSGYALLSELEPSYGVYMDEQEKLMSRSFRATIHMRKDVAKKLAEKQEKTIKRWEKIDERTRDPELLKRVISGTAFSLMGWGRQFDHFILSSRYRKTLEKQQVKGINDWTELYLDMN